MLTMVEAVNDRGQVLQLPLHNVYDGYVVRSIEGLDPVKAQIVTSSHAQLDGTKYQTSRRENRDIIMRLGLEPDYASSTVQDLRGNLYAFFMPKSNVTLRFYLDGVHFADISGRVESCEAPLFSNDPEMAVSIMCFDPDFVSPTVSTVSGTTMEGMDSRNITYVGTVPAGFKLHLELGYIPTRVEIYNTSQGGHLQQFIFGGSLESNDVMDISTVPGDKHTIVTRGTTTMSVLQGVSPVSTWVQLVPGDNDMRIIVKNTPGPFTLEYQARYGGL